MILKWLSKFWPILLLTLLAGVVTWRNVTPGTYLTGWDNLHPEFDFKTNIIDRGLKGVWQYYQGLGIPSGNAHIADLPRQIVLWIVSWLVPQNLIRYGYHLVAWLMGGIGMYVLLLRLLITALEYRKKQVVALAGSIFYLFNLGTLQNFYAPYEAFSHFYLMLPWLMYTSWIYLRDGGKKKLVHLTIANLLAVPMTYIPTIFIVYMVVMGVVWIGELFRSRLKNWKRVAANLGLILVVNAFWLMPFVHFVAQNTEGVVDAKINRMFTQEAYLRNEEYGEPKHSLIMEGFWFDTTDLISEEGTHDWMMRPWMDYLDKPLVREMMYGLAGIIFLGYFIAILQKKKFVLETFVLLLIGLFCLINTNFPTGQLFKYLQDNLPLFAQVLRFPYTKLIVVVAVGYSVGIAYFALWVIKYLRWFGNLLVCAVIASVLYVQKPTFTGHFFYDQLRVSIPQEYFELFSFFQNEDRLRGRIANLPQPTFWGWTTYDWGYRGSGFPWYGIPQPILDRNFDVWSPESEKYFSEISNAIYDNNDKDYFYSVLDKYGIDYVWIDGRLINPQKPEMISMKGVEEWLNTGGYEEVFSEGEQTIYKRNKPILQEGEVESHEVNWKGNPVVELNKDNIPDGDIYRYLDSVFTKVDLPKYYPINNDSENTLYAYYNSEIKVTHILSPVSNKTYKIFDILSDLEIDDRNWLLSEVYVSYSAAKGEGFRLCLKKSDGDCYYVGVDTNTDGGYRWGKFQLSDTTSPREVSLLVTGNVDLHDIYIGYHHIPDKEIALSNMKPVDGVTTDISLYDHKFEATNCYIFGDGKYSREPVSENSVNFVRYSAYDASSCEYMNIGDSSILASGGEIALTTRNISGRPVKFCLRLDPPGDCLVEEIVGGGKDWTTSKFIIPPVTKKADLYLEIDNYAVGRETRTNDVSDITIVGSYIQNSVVVKESRLWNNQAFRNGWIAYQNGQILEHVKVNGWANGWVVGTGTENKEYKIWIFYWPQMLEYLGFGILGFTFVGLAWRRK